MPTDVAEIFDKSGDNTLILNTRCQLVYPFVAPNWTDLRAAFLLSLTKTDDDDDTTDLGETIDLGANPNTEFVWIGLKTNNDLLPIGGANVGFIGYTNWVNPQFTSNLVTSDEGIGTDNAFYWRPRPSSNNSAAAAVTDGLGTRANFTNVNPHFVQDPDNTAGYATLLMLRVTRPNASSRNLTVSIKQGTHSGDVLFTSTPSNDVMEANMADYPSTVQTHTIPNMQNIPDSLYAYWPFHESRLRIHATGFLKFR
jgi:hypothetical protein